MLPLRVKFFALLLLWLPLLPAIAENRLHIMVQGQDFELHQYPADGQYLALWFTSRGGLGERQAQVARGLQQLGVETWQIDLIENLFLPRSSDSIRQIDPGLLGDLVEEVQRKSDKQVVIISNAYGAILALRGLRAWQQQEHHQTRLLGAVMFTPYAYQGIPSLGLPPEYIAEAHATNMPLMILQSERNGNRQQLDDLLAVLREGGSEVFVQLMPGVTSMFYEEDNSAAALEHLQLSPQYILRAIRLMTKLEQPANPAPLAKEANSDAQDLGLDIGLKPFLGNWNPPPISLNSASGQHYDLHNYRGKVRLINFWATWCPPCVEEIPSLNRLREKLDGEAFELISINYAQQSDEVQKFMDQVEVRFPVLIDYDGTESAKWRVIAFPSTFVIDGNGKIRYGVNAAIEWDAPRIIGQLQKLIDDTTQ